MFPFGKGMGYADFFLVPDESPGWPATVKATETATFSVVVKNMGSKGAFAGAASTVVLAFVQAAAVTVPDAPLQQLFAFARTAPLAPGESQTVTLELTPEGRTLFAADGTRVVSPPGVYRVQIGGDASGGGLAATLRVV